MNAIALIAGALLAALLAPASAHEWYTGLTNAQGQDCCGGQHGRAVLPGDVLDTPEGLLVRHGEEWLLVPDDAILEEGSPDGMLHVCILGIPPMVRCLIKPAAT